MSNPILSPGASRLLKAMAAGGGKTSTFTLDDMRAALEAVGWRLGDSVIVRPGYMSYDDYEQFERRSPLYKELRAAGVAAMSGALSQKDPVDLYTEPGHETAIQKVLAGYHREPSEVGDIQFGAYLGPASGHGRFALQTKPWLIGKPAIEITDAGGNQTVVSLKAEERGMYSSAQLWTWGFKNGLQEAAKSVLAGESVQTAQPKTLRTLENTGTCPACFANVKLARGQIMRHGWTSSGGGSFGAGAWHSGHCIGWNWPPYEVSPEGTKEALKRVKAHRDVVAASIDNPSPDVYDFRGKLIPQDSPNYHPAVKARQSRLKNELLDTGATMKFYEDKISSWVPKNLPRTASVTVGPYIAFNGKVWQLPLNMKHTVQPGKWTSATLVDRTGKPLRTEVEFTWPDRPGEIQVFVSGRKRVTYTYEDKGDFAPDVTDKDVKAELRKFPDEKTLASKLVRAHGNAAMNLVGDVLTDVNMHGLARHFPESFNGNVSSVSSQIDYDAQAAIVLAFYIATALRQVAPAEAALEAIKAILRKDMVAARR